MMTEKLATKGIASRQTTTQTACGNESNLENDPKNEDCPKIEDNHKNEVDPPNKYAPKNENKNEDDRGLCLLFMKFAFTNLSQSAIVFVTLSSFFIYFSKMVDLMKMDG